MANNIIEKSVSYLNKPTTKGVIAAIIFHILYSFAFGMLIGGKNPLVFLYNNGNTTLYMILMPLLASLPYILSGYLLTLARNKYEGLNKKNFDLLKSTLFFAILGYTIAYMLNYYLPYRESYGFYIFFNYPAASYLSVMDKTEYAQNLIVILSAIFPPIMTYVGGKVRIQMLNKGDLNG